MCLSTDPPRILIVDDQPSNVRLLEHTLRRGGYGEVASTVDPRQVEAMYLASRYDLILLDLQMPHMTGFEVMTCLRGHAGGDRVAILVMSADPSLMLAALEGGANSFLSKPFVLADVLARVQLLLNAVAPRERDEPAPPQQDADRF